MEQVKGDSMLEIKKADSIHSDGLKALIYSDAGVGKTTLASTLDMNKTLVISFESGLLSILDEESGADIQYVEPTSLTELRNVYEALLQPEYKEQFDNIFIDSLTEISEMMFKEYKANPALYTGRQDTLKLYGEVQNDMIALVKAFRDLKGYNVFMTALEESVVKQMKDVASIAMIGKKLGTKMAPLFDFVWHLEVNEEGQRILRTQPTDTVLAKSRTRKLLAEETANLTHVLHKVRGTK